MIGEKDDFKNFYNVIMRYSGTLLPKYWFTVTAFAKY